MAKQRQEKQPEGAPVTLDDVTHGLTPPPSPPAPLEPVKEKAIAPDPKGFKAKESATVYTFEGQFSYPILFNKIEGKKFQVNVAIPQDRGNVDDIVKAVNAVGLASFPDHWQGIENMKYPPVKDGAGLKDPKPGFWIIQPKSDERPGVFYNGGTKQITDRTAVYGGCFGEVALVAKSYCFPDRENGEINWGVTLVLKDVMKTKDGENLAKKSFKPAAGEEQQENGKPSEDIPF